MALRKIRLGELIEQTNNTNSSLEFGINDVMGVTITKDVIPTKADIKDTDLSKFLIVKPKEFVYNPRTHGKKIGLGFNWGDKPFIITWNDISFKIKDQKIIIPEYLFMILNRNEWDRKACFDSWGSSTVVFSWESMCDIEIELPDLPTQEKFVKVYLSMLENQKSYERGLDDIKLVCDAYIEDLRKSKELRPLSKFLTRRMEKNKNFTVKKLLGVGKDGFIEPKQSKDETNGHICYLVKNGDFVFAPPQLHAGAIDYYQKAEVVKCSDAYIVFYINNEMELDPFYLLMMLKNKNNQKKIWYFRDGVREQFDFDQLCELEIPVPLLIVQKSLAEIYKVYLTRKQINEQLKEQIKNICPILIKGSIEEAKEA